MDPVHQVNALLDEAAEMPLSAARVSVVERAVRIADTIDDDELAFGARLELVTTATFAGMPERSLVAFAWLLAKVDAEPDRFDVEQLLFPYRWVVEDVPYLLSVSTDRVDALIDDMAERYERQWWWEHPVWEARLRWSMVRGAPHIEVERLYGRWRLEFARSGNPRGGHEVHVEILALCYLNRWNEAVTVARPAMSGRLPIEEEYPARTYAALLAPARVLGLAEREHWRERAAELCGGNQVFIREAATIIDDAVDAGETPPEHLVQDLDRWVDTSRDEHGVMMARATLALADVGDIESHVEAALELANRFDARHGNRAVSELVVARLGPRSPVS